ncbi:MAG: glycerophosphodiester phosphodiesterase family protein [Kineosporiaceae bacterium]
MTQTSGLATTRIVAHRGGAGMAPENTMRAFTASRRLGLATLETDLRVTSDGVVVAFHDADGRRAAGVRARVADSSWAQVRQWRVGGEPVPRLEEVLEGTGDARLLMDLKDPRAIGPMARVLRGARATERVCLAGASDRWLADVRAVLGPHLTTAMGWESLTRLVLAARCGRRPVGVVRAPAVHVPLRLGGLPVFAERLVALATELGARVLVWTVDDPAVASGLLARGVDAVITDRPDLLAGGCALSA